MGKTILQIWSTLDMLRETETELIILAELFIT